MRRRLWVFFFSSRRRHTRCTGDWSSDVCSSDLLAGKTRLMFDLLSATDTSFCSSPPTMLVAKPRDQVVTAGIARLGYKEIDRWPPRKSWFGEPPAGYAYWPKHLTNVDPEI